MADNYGKILFSISYREFPKNWWGDIRDFGTTVEVPIEFFKCLKIKTEINIPFRKSWVILEDSKTDLFLQELLKLECFKIKNVYSIRLNFTTPIYNSNLTKEITNRSLFEIPEKENIKKSTYKEKNLFKYLSYKGQELFANWKTEARPTWTDSIGYTARSKEERSKGKELRCIVSHNNTNSEEHIFLTGVTLFNKKISMDSSADYYLATEEIVKQIEKEFEKIAFKYKEFEKIILKTKFFDRDIHTIDINQNFTKFSNEIKFFYTFEYQVNEGIKQIKNSKTGIFDCSYRKAPDLTLEEYLELENKYENKRSSYDVTNDDLPF